MASLNLSTNGPSISKSYQSVVNAPPSTGNAAKSSTYGQWAIYSVSTPLINAFQQDAGGKESVLKVQSTGEGELVDLIDEFSDGRVQFAFVKVKDPNTSLPKHVLIGWCGEGVPERTKGYFMSHLAAVSKVLHGYHVQITARSDRDLTPDGIVQKVSDASGSKYSGGATPTPGSAGPPPPISSKPAFTPTRSTGGAGGYNPLTKPRVVPKNQNVDEDGWGADAPPVTRTQLEKVQSSYQPTKVNMRELSSQKQEPSKLNVPQNGSEERSDVVKGGYQPVGKVDIAALRKHAQSAADDRPTVVKGAYEPIGKVDIAAIRARAQQPSEGATSPPSNLSPSVTGSSSQGGFGGQSSLSERSTPFSTSERLTSLPKPKVANRFGSNASSFTGTKAPTPGGFGLESKPSLAAPIPGVGRTFADQGGKTPAQLWAEKKARESGSGISVQSPPANIGGPTSPVASQTSGGGQWKSGYTGKSWAPVQTTKTGQSATSSTGQQEEDQQDEPPQSGGIAAIRDRFKEAPPMGAVALGSDAPPLHSNNKPAMPRGVPMPGLPSRPAQQEAPRLPSPPLQPRSPTPPQQEEEEEPSSPVRIAMPVPRSQEPAEVEDAHDEQFSPPPPMPTRSLAAAVPHEDQLEEEQEDPGRGASEAMAAHTFGQQEAAQAQSHSEADPLPGAGKTALIQFDYEKAEDNELELKEGEYVTNIEMVDEDWWMGQNSRGETGLFPSNYVVLQDDEEAGGHAPMQQQHQSEPEPEAALEEQQHHHAGTGAVATALYDYEAAEDNELSFPEGAKITNVEFPDEDWWSGEHAGKQGLFPANYVQLDE